jgi:hypothetical protein
MTRSIVDFKTSILHIPKKLPLYARTYMHFLLRLSLITSHNIGYLAQNRAFWGKAVRDGSEFFMDNWINNESKRSYERFLPGFL